MSKFSNTFRFCASPSQPPSPLLHSPYVGNLAALQHNVRHHVECKHTFGGAAATAKVDRKDFAPAASAKGDADNASSAATAEGDQRLQIAVMIRCDVFRELRARKKNSTPGPAEFFRVVKYAAATHLADVAVALPDMTEVLDEVARTASMGDSLGDSAATVS